MFFSADWLHDYRLHGMGSIHFCDSQSVPGRNFGKISKWPYVMSYHMLKSTFLHFSDIYLRRHWIGFHPLLFGVDWMGWWGLGKSLPSQTFFVLRCGIHDCGNWRNYFTQHCEIRGTNTFLENHKLCPKTPFLKKQKIVNFNFRVKKGMNYYDFMMHWL